MEWLEILHVHAVGPREKIRILETCTHIHRSGSTRLTVYGNTLDSELKIHILWRSETVPEDRMSPLGRELSRVAGELAMVTHTLWQEYSPSEVREMLPAREGVQPEKARSSIKRVCDRLFCALLKGRNL